MSDGCVVVKFKLRDKTVVKKGWLSVCLAVCLEEPCCLHVYDVWSDVSTRALSAQRQCMPWLPAISGRGAFVEYTTVAKQGSALCKF